ncbi:hypothetical protein ALC60_11278 [Trachymyrmex zeteki]|uniref:DNA-directed DNA polymerase n=1 Tax=Mycetomoellerius zeteki TaxID=64791 RepID=A0A151WPM8_9HYME|nr:hypothetical protein ALC60_11278 [Trachymyrmex zeteki]
MRNFLENVPIIKNSPLDSRDAFFGGRTGNIATRCEVVGTEKIRYVDVCSLYPYVLKTGTFPIGHPIFYEQELARIEKNLQEEQFIIARVIKSRGRGTNKQLLVM